MSELDHTRCQSLTPVVHRHCVANNPFLMGYKRLAMPTIDPQCFDLSFIISSEKENISEAERDIRNRIDLLKTIRKLDI